MTKEKFLTRRWNYIISVVQGLPTFAFVLYGLSTPFGSTKAGMITLSILGALFWLFLEYHTSARFAWLQKNVVEGISKPDLSTVARIMLTVHNLLFWFFLVPFFTPMSFKAGFAVYSIILLVHFISNSYINLRGFTPEEYYAYPIRIP